MDGTAAPSETVAPLGAIPAPGVVERGLEHSIFATRWLLVPFYLGLVAGLLVLMTAFAKKIWVLAGMTLTASMNDLTVAILGLVDLCLMANLIVMILFAGYESFVSRLDIGAARLAWMGRIGFGDLKLRLIASIAAISAIHLLEDFMESGQLSDRHLAWRVGIHLTFVVSGVMLAFMDRMVADRH